MKDVAHHRTSVQKKVLRSIRKDQKTPNQKPNDTQYASPELRRKFGLQTLDLVR